MSLGIYVHVPFCKAKCLYCDFNSYAGLESKTDTYLSCLFQEIEQNRSDKKVNSLYIGGGTPTVLSPNQLCGILEKIKECYALTEDCEITMECNPGTIDMDGLTTLAQGGFRRISIGIQAGQEDMLKRLGRIHTFSQGVECVHQAKMAGFSSVSVDLMFGLPGQTMMQWQETLKQVCALPIDHLSCYGLKVEEGTPLATQKPNLPDDDTVAAFYDFCVSFLQEQGFHRYEISNFARGVEKESRHNKKYWACDDFLGFGAGAYSCVDHVRYANISNIDAYCKAMLETRCVIDEKIPLTAQDEMAEFCFLGLRMDAGISETAFQKRFHCPIDHVFGDVIKKNLRRGTLLRLGDILKINPEFTFVSNSILADFV